jgi:hypothetical protein
VKININTTDGTISFEKNGETVTANIEIVYDLLTLPKGQIIQSLGQNHKGYPQFKVFMMPDWDGNNG